MDRRVFLQSSLLAAAATALPRAVFAQANRPTLSVAVPGISNSGTLEPLREQNNTAIRTLYSILETLTDVDRQGDLSLNAKLAESYRRLDERSVEFTIRKGVKFHNGAELTAEDVVFSYGPERMFGTTQGGSGAKPAPTEVAAAGKRIWSTIESIKDTGSNTVIITTKKPDLTLEARFSRLGAEIISRKGYMDAADWTAWSRAPIGTGPYKVADFRGDTELILDSHDDYWGGLPPAKQIRLVVVPEVASRVNGLFAGQYDLIVDVPPDQLKGIGSTAGVKAIGGAVLNILELAFDKTNPVLADPRIRQALTQAIDRQIIVDSLWDKRTDVPKGLQYKFYGDMFIDDWTAPAFDPEKAKALLAEAGYAGGAIPFRVQNNYYPNQVSTAQILQGMWSAVGLNVVIEMKENGAQVTDASSPRGIRQWSNVGSFGDPVSSLVFQMGPTGPLQTNKEWSNDEFNALSGELETGTDPAKRKQTFRRMLEIIEVEDPAYTVLHQNAIFYGIKDSIDWNPSQLMSLDFRAENLKFKG